MNNVIRHLVALVALALVAAPALAQSMPASSVAQAGFARAVAVGAGDVFIGEANNNTKPGVVHIFQRGTTNGEWRLYAEVQADNGTVDDRFGQSVATTSGMLLIGAEGEDEAGTVFVFKRALNGAWTQKAQLSAPTPESESMFGAALSVYGQLVVVGAPGSSERAGAAYVFMYDKDAGAWTSGTMITGSDTESGDRFGSAVATDGEHIFVAAPRHEAGNGAVYSFSRDDASSSWTQSSKLDGADAGEGGFFGSALALAADQLFVGAARANEGLGRVLGYGWRDGGWTITATLDPDTSLGQGGFYGMSLASTGSSLIVGAPGASSRTGTAIPYHEHDGMMMPESLNPSDLDSRDGFATTLAAAGDVFVAGVTGDDFGAGSAKVFERHGNEWVEAATVVGQSDNLMAVMGNEVTCADGMAGDFGCEQVDLLSFVPVEQLGGGRGARVNDVWGWTDSQTNREYAIVGRIDGTSFVDVTDPSNPIYKGNLPRTDGTPASTWRDMKTYRDHVFIVADGAGDHGMQVFDLTQLREVDEPTTFEATVHYDRIASAHNIVINEDTGFAYTVGNSSGGETCGGGLHMINIQDPTSPEFVGCFADATTGRASTGYSHDAMCIVYNGPDSEYQGREICFGSNETALSVADVSDKNAPVALSTASYPNVGYAHQGWITEDHRFFYLDDELDELSGKVDGTRTMIWDVSDLDDPQLVREYISTNKSSDHNLYIRGNFMYQSNYQSGLRIFDISDPANPIPVGHFDTVPYGEDEPGFGGSWSNYPFFTSGSVLVTSGSEGLFVVRKREIDI